MLEYTGFDALVAAIDGAIKEEVFATLLCADLTESLLTICPAPLPDELTSDAALNPLVILKTLVDAPPIYIKREKKIVLELQGLALGNARPVWFRLQGKTVAMSGRCSVTVNCCGSDLRLPKDFLQRVGETVKLTYGVDVGKVLNEMA